MTERRTLSLILFLVFVLAGAGERAKVVGRGEQSDRSKEFSRSAWIARYMGQARFSGGVLPAGDPLPVPARAVVIESAEDLLVSEPLRVNSDLLAADIIAQPETQAEPHLHANPSNSGNLLAAWQENRFSNGGARALGYGASFDGGQTWVEGLLPQATVAAGGPWEKASDPWVAFGPAGRAYFASLLFNQTTPDNAIGVSVSTNGGLTWGQPVEVARANNGDFNDKEAVTVDTFPNSPFFGNVYVAWDINIARGGNFVAQRLVVARSTDGGETYAAPAVVRKKKANVGVIPRVGPNGTVYLIWVGGGLNSNKIKIFFSKSTDGGLSWTPKRKLGKVRSSGIPNLRTGSFLTSFDVDQNTGDLYVAWVDRRWTGVDQATMMISRDGGNTWSSPVRVSDGPDDAPAFTISVAANGNGEVAVSYYSLQNDPARNFLTDKFVRVSRNRGNSFEPSMRVTRSTFDVRFAAQTSGGFFLGDYVGLTGTNSGFHLLWVSPHLPSILNPARLQPDVFTSSTEEQELLRRSKR